jgi:hypothetical protein
MLDVRPHRRPRGIAARDVRRHRPAARLGALELRDQPVAIQQPQIGLAAVGGVRPYAAGRIGAIEQGGKLTAVMARGMGDGTAAAEAGAAAGQQAGRRHRSVVAPP